jgi:hypothetical protein
MPTAIKPRKLKPKAQRPLTEVLQDLQVAHRLCQDYMSARTRLHLQMLSICRRALSQGRASEDEKERKKLCADAVTLLDKAKAGEAPALAVLMTPMFSAFNTLEEEERRHAKQLGKLALELPIAPWIDGICGLGEVSVARIVAELGDPGNYSNPAKCWKRLGLAVMGGCRQGHVPKEITGDERSAIYVAHGYSPRRRSIVFVAVESLLRKQNVYKTIYDNRKVYEIPRVETAMHAHRRAQRYAGKRLILDLWREWRKAIGLPYEPAVTTAVA